MEILTLRAGLFRDLGNASNTPVLENASQPEEIYRFHCTEGMRGKIEGRPMSLSIPADA
jgi:hypothetical protein